MTINKCIGESSPVYTPLRLYVIDEKYFLIDPHSDQGADMSLCFDTIE